MKEGDFSSAFDFQKKEKEAQTMDKVRVFENVKTPHELLGFMQKNIDYGYIGKNNKRVYSWKDEDMGKDFVAEYFLQSPQELIKSGHGVCFDSTELERYWFEKNGYEIKTLFMIFAKQFDNDLPTHTFLAYKERDKWLWFEHSFGDQRGIHEYDTFEDLVMDVKKKHFDYAAEHRGATSEDEKDLLTFEFEKPEYGSNMREFVDHAASGKRLP
jgi:hypothetical protein